MGRLEQHGVSDGGVGGVHDVQPSPQQQQQQQPPSGVHHVQLLQQQQQLAQAPQMLWDIGTEGDLDDCLAIAGLCKDTLRRRVPVYPDIKWENIWKVIIGV